jgi:uncharacterized membrane protein
MKLSLHRDLLLVIISSLAVLTISWLQLVKGNVLTFIEYVAILLLPGYSLMTAIWPSEDRIEWSLRAGVGFVLGLFFVLFLPIILESQNMGFLNENLTGLLLILAVLLSLVAMVRRREPSEEEAPYGGKQLTLEESIQRAAELRERQVDEHEDDEYEYDVETGHFEYYDEEPELEESPEDERESYQVTDEEEYEEPDEYQQLREEKPLQYQRMRERGYFDEESSEETRPESMPLHVDEDVKTEPYSTGYEEEMDRPVWMDEEPGQKTGRNWYNFLRNIILTILIFGIILAVMDLLGWNTGLLQDISKYSMEIILVTSIILVAMVFLRKFLKTEAPVEEYEEEISEGAGYEEEIEQEEYAVDEFLEPEQGREAVQTPPPTETAGIVSKEHREPPHYKPRNYYLDIILILALTLLTVAFILVPALNKTFVRTILGILLVLFIPGYSLIAALFPKWGDLDGIERAALSFGLSIAVTPLIGLGLNYTPWGIRLDPILISLTIFTLAMSLIAYLRRRNLPEGEKFFVPFGEFTRSIKESFKRESRTEKILSIILIISIILAISTTVYIIVKPKQGEKFTEFYILGPDGKASDYPTNLTNGDVGRVIIGVVNHEYATTNYKLLVKVGNRTLKNDTFTLKNGEKKEIPFNFTAGNNGQKKMQFLLYKLPDQGKAYRSLHLWLNITS